MINRSVRYRWFEYLLAACVVAVVVASLTVQRSLSSSTESQVHELAHKLGKNMLVVPAETEFTDFYAMRYGDTAEHGMSRSLLEHRRVLYVITASVIAFCILIWSYLNAGERRLEMATVVAIGGTGMTVLSMLVIRAAIVGFLGGLVGYAGGAFIALVQDFQPSVGVVLSWNLVCLMSGGAVVLSILGGLPASLLSAYREHVTVLQEW